MRKYIVRIFYARVPAYIERDYDLFLLKHSNYYQNLNDRLRKLFRKRLYHLLNVLSFGSTKFPVVTREMRVVIGSSIIEITFGLDSYIPSRFVNIIVLPHRYMYPGYGEPFLGHIDYESNTLHFSWADVKAGYKIPNDAVNVALHEMAHVLEAENKFNYLFSSFFERVDWNEWARLAFEKMQIIRKGENKFLKNYGGINMTEMFAVCIEAFFEQPSAFKKNLPQIYKTMVSLLRQDPTRMGNPLI